MRRTAGLTLLEMFVVFAVMVLLIAILLPALGSARRGARATRNPPQLRGIHTGLVLYAQGNNSHYPGVMSDGANIDPAVGLTTQGRTQILIDQNYFSIEYARSISEVQTGTTSYAMLKIDSTPNSSTIAKSIRNSEWNDTFNTDAVIVSDRAVPNGETYEFIRSIHTKPKPGKSDWRGGVAWNDNHVSFESTFNHITKYGTKKSGTASHTADHLFATSNVDHGDDAFMVWHGSDGL